MLSVLYVHSLHMLCVTGMILTVASLALCGLSSLEYFNFLNFSRSRPSEVTSNRYFQLERISYSFSHIHPDILSVGRITMTNLQRTR